MKKLLLLISLFVFVSACSKDEEPLRAPGMYPFGFTIVVLNSQGEDLLNFSTPGCLVNENVKAYFKDQEMNLIVMDSLYLATVDSINYSTEIKDFNSFFDGSMRSFGWIENYIGESYLDGNNKITIGGWFVDVENEELVIDWGEGIPRDTLIVYFQSPYIKREDGTYWRREENVRLKDKELQFIDGAAYVLVK